MQTADPLGVRVFGLDARVPTINDDEGHATDLASPDRDGSLLPRVSCWARRPRSRRPYAEVSAYKFFASPVLSSFVFMDATRTGGLWEGANC